jgi:two-component system, NtrC family, sensor histidine kinase HydH
MSESPEPLISCRMPASGGRLASWVDRVRAWAATEGDGSAERPGDGDMERLRRRLGRAEHLAGLGILAAGLAHELATPLTVVSACAEDLARSDGLSAAEVQQARMIVDQSARAERLLRGFLDLATVREVRPRPTDAAGVATSVLAVLAGRLERHHVRGEVVARAPVIAEVDPDRLHQVIMNLVTNALDAMPGGGELTIDVGRADGLLLIDVADTGTGIVPDLLPRLFDPFLSTKGRGGGVGLGLHVVREIVEAHGGHVEVASSRGAGAIFRIRIPLVAAHG